MLCTKRLIVYLLFIIEKLIRSWENQKNDKRTQTVSKQPPFLNTESNLSLYITDIMYIPRQMSMVAI